MDPHVELALIQPKKTKVMAFAASEPGSIPPNWIRMWSWPTINLPCGGACHLSGTQVYLYPDGTFYFMAWFNGNDEGDSWVVRGLHFLDAGNNPVGGPYPDQESPKVGIWRSDDSQWFQFSGRCAGVTDVNAPTIRYVSWVDHC
jgi:hypothetical protein